MTKETTSYVDRVARKLDGPRRPWTAVAVLGATVTLWVAVLAGWVPMPMPADVPASAPGATEMAATTGGAVAEYLTMWGAMMSAMMYPAMLPFARRYVDSLEGSPVAIAAALATFFVAYSAVWTATGVVPLAVESVVDIGGLVRAAPSAVYGGALLVVGAYQLSSFKRAALRDCCSGVSVTDPSLGTAAKTGLAHGQSCVVATWPLFAFLVLAGSMNVFWMTALTAVVVAERLPGWGGEIADAVGVVAAVAGVLVLLPLPFPFP